MPTYITLNRYTQKGIENIKDGPARLDAAKKNLATAGGKLIGFYLTMGQYDLVTIAEFPDDESAARAGLFGGSQGFVRRDRRGNAGTDGAGTIVFSRCGNTIFSRRNFAPLPPRIQSFLILSAHCSGSTSDRPSFPQHRNMTRRCPYRDHRSSRSCRRPRHTPAPSGL